jgi:SAM-dependent methyltransferase
MAGHLRRFRKPRHARILDAGCGSGAKARLLASHYPGTEVVGIDLNPGYLAYARARASADGLTNLSFEPGNLQHLPFADARFDIVWSHLVLYFLPSPEAALREFRRVLRPGGRVIIVLNERTLLTNFPEDPDLQERLERVIFGFGDVALARKLPLMLHEATFDDISVELETDRIYTKIGRIGPDHRRNVEEILTSAMSRIAEVLGGRTQAETFLADLLAYLDRPDTCSYTTLWIITGVVADR